jgi:hypothetical protein
MPAPRRFIATPYPRRLLERASPPMHEPARRPRAPVDDVPGARVVVQVSSATRTACCGERRRAWPKACEEALTVQERHLQSVIHALLLIAVGEEAPGGVGYGRLGRLLLVARSLGLSSLSPPSLSKGVTEPQCKHSVSVSSLAVPALATTGPTAVLTASRRFPMPTSPLERITQPHVRMST